jgi:hypothetical protein
MFNVATIANRNSDLGTDRGFRSFYQENTAYE